jgi:hypothetical protein
MASWWFRCAAAELSPRTRRLGARAQVDAKNSEGRPCESALARSSHHPLIHARAGLWLTGRATGVSSKLERGYDSSDTTIMRARQLIEAAPFGPDALKAISEAFEAAWSEIAPRFGDDPAEIENARLKLANALLSIADDESRDVPVLKRSALQRMALAYRRRT